MAWIRSHTVLQRHRKIIELSKELRLRQAYTMGHLHSLWHTALEQQEDGDLSDWSDKFLADSSDFPGDASQWVRLLQKYGFLDGRLLHDWLDYAGPYLKSKYHESGPDKLSAIWAKHGQEYKSGRSRQPLGDPPNLILSGSKPNGNDRLLGMVYPPGFTAFWDSYPRKLGQKGAIDAWVAISPDGELQKTILAALSKQKLLWNDPQFVPAPAKWLNEHRWKDEIQRPQDKAADMSKRYFQEIDGGK